MRRQAEHIDAMDAVKEDPAQGGASSLASQAGLPRLGMTALTAVTGIAMVWMSDPI